MLYSAKQIDNNSFKRVNSINSNMKDSNKGSSQNSHDDEEFIDKLNLDDEDEKELKENNKELEKLIFNDNNSYYMNISLVE